MQSEAQHYPVGHDWCRNPGRYHSEDVDATEDEVSDLVYGFVRALQPDILVETGTYSAQTTMRIGEALVRNGHGHLWSVETDQERAEHGRVLCAVAKLPVTVVHAHSLRWLPEWLGGLDGPIDFAWVDSGAERVREAKLLLPHFRPHGIMGVHDMANDFRWTFYRDFEPLFESGELQPITLRTPRGVTFAEVRP